jgi:hypothetical protein
MKILETPNVTNIMSETYLKNITNDDIEKVKNVLTFLLIADPCSPTGFMFDWGSKDNRLSLHGCEQTQEIYDHYFSLFNLFIPQVRTDINENVPNRYLRKLDFHIEPQSSHDKLAARKQIVTVLKTMDAPKELLWYTHT